MASSIQTFGEKAESFNDLDLLVLLQFLDEIISRSAGHTNLRSVIDQWNAGVRIYGPGVLDLALENTLKTPVERYELTSILKQVRQQIAGYGNSIPSSILNERNPAPGVIFTDYPTSLVREAATRLEKLVTDEVSS